MPGNLPAALAVFVLGGIAILVLGTILTLQFGSTDDSVDAGVHVFGSMLGDVGRVAVGRPRALSALGALRRRAARAPS